MSSPKALPLSCCIATSSRIRHCRSRRNAWDPSDHLRNHSRPPTKAVQSRPKSACQRRQRASQEACWRPRWRAKDSGYRWRKKTLLTSVMHHERKRLYLGRREELGCAAELPSCRGVRETEFSWAGIVSNEARSDTCKWRSEGNSRCSKQIGGQVRLCEGRFEGAAQALAPG
jgi:hypothetical protein